MFNVVATDVIGPMDTRSITGDYYAITFTEIHSRYRWCYPIKTKDEALDALKLFTAELASYGYKIKQLKSDNGGEFTSTEFKELCKTKEIFQH